MLSVLASLIVSALTPIRYSSTAALLVVQRGVFGRDPSVASRSTEYLAQLLAQVVNSGSFLTAVRTSNPKVFSELPQEPNQQKRWWNKRVQPYVVRDTGILKITAFDRDQQRAGELATAVLTTLIERGAEYHGEGDAVSIRVIESPLTTRWPATPNILRNLIVGLVAGLIGALALVYLFPEYNFSFKGRRRSASITNWHVPAETVEATVERVNPSEQGSSRLGSNDTPYSSSESHESRGTESAHETHPEPRLTRHLEHPSSVILSQVEGSPDHDTHTASEAKDLPTIWEHMSGREGP